MEEETKTEVKTEKEEPKSTKEIPKKADEETPKKKAEKSASELPKPEPKMSAKDIFNAKKRPADPNKVKKDTTVKEVLKQPPPTKLLKEKSEDSVSNTKTPKSSHQEKPEKSEKMNEGSMTLKKNLTIEEVSLLNENAETAILKVFFTK